MRISPKAVIFDYGNVLSESQPAADVQAMANILEVPVPRFTEVYWQFRIAYDAASLDPFAYWNAVARTASRTLTPDQISALVEIDSRGWSHPAPVTSQWARDLRAAGLRTALLSNMPFPSAITSSVAHGSPISTSASSPARPAFASRNPRSIEIA